MRNEEQETFSALGVSSDLVAVLDRAGLTTAFPVQRLCIPDALAGRDVCGKAKTGSGKTLAFGLPLVERVTTASPKRPTGLVLVPTRELAVQVTDVLRPLVEARDLRLVAVYGGAGIEQAPAGDQVVGVNANYLHAEKDPAIPQALKVFVEQLLRESLSIVLIPHDTRSKRPDQKLLEDAVAHLSAAERERVHLLPPVSPGVVRAVTPALDMLATGRMHTAILALSGGTAPFNFAYQDKFEGLLEFFKLDAAGLLSTPKELATDPVGVAEKFLQVLKEKERYEQQIHLHLPDVLRLAQANFI